MAKPVYRIPDGLDKSVLDTQINLKTESGVSTKPMTMRTLLLWIGAVMAWFLLATNSFLSESGPVWLILFTVCWFTLAWQLLKTGRDGLPQYQLLPVAITYWPAARRTLNVRSADPAWRMGRASGIRAIDPDAGRVDLACGASGFLYEVAGNASTLLFDQDRDLIIDRVDAFLRKLPAETDLHVITVKHAQNTGDQAARLQAVAQDPALEPDVRALAAWQAQTLRDAQTDGMKSIHQYVFLTGDHTESLMAAKAVLQGEIERSDLAFKHVRPLFGEELVTVLARLYNPGGRHA